MPPTRSNSITVRRALAHVATAAAATATAAAAVLILSATPALAADTSSDPPPAATVRPAAVDPLSTARAHISVKRWPQALDELRRVNATGSADWNNLYGYALRMQAAPDLEGAQRAYDNALRIDPKHKGALSYSGELALMKGDLPLAEQKAGVLTSACAGACSELDDLKKSIARFKANGNRYQAGGGAYGS